MSGAAHNLDQEFWRPPQQIPSLARPSVPTEICSRCNNEFVVGSRFCHVCGAQRETEAKIRAVPGIDWLRQSLGLTAGSMIAFVSGLVCLGFAVATGLMYTASTVLEWQAIQMWRMQWLLGSAAAFLAGILLKRVAH